MNKCEYITRTHTQCNMYVMWKVLSIGVYHNHCMEKNLLVIWYYTWNFGEYTYIHQNRDRVRDRQRERKKNTSPDNIDQKIACTRYTKKERGFVLLLLLLLFIFVVFFLNGHLYTLYVFIHADIQQLPHKLVFYLSFCIKNFDERVFFLLLLLLL